jgi:hypothetical protein
LFLQRINDPIEKARLATGREILIPGPLKAAQGILNEVANGEVWPVADAPWATSNDAGVALSVKVVEPPVCAAMYVYGPVTTTDRLMP